MTPRLSVAATLLIALAALIGAGAFAAFGQTSSSPREAAAAVVTALMVAAVVGGLAHRRITRLLGKD